MKRKIVIAGGMGVLVVLSGLLLGLVPLTPAQALRALVGVPGTETTRLVLLHVRLPRILVAWIVGSALSVAGCALQGAFRNPLADPSVLGVSAGAALGAQLLLLLVGGTVAMTWLPLAACGGALLAMFLLLAIVGGTKSGGIEVLVLGGVAIGQVAVAASALLLSLALADYTVAQRLMRWTLGSLDGRTYTHVVWGALPTVVGSAWIGLRARQLDAMMLGDATAIALGVPVAKLRRELVVGVAILSGVTVAVAGMISFVGLVVPHMVRRWVGARHGVLLPFSWWIGGATVVAADAISRSVVAPAELQLGAVTAAVGAPWFIVVLRRRLRETTA